MLSVDYDQLFDLIMKEVKVIVIVWEGDFKQGFAPEFGDDHAHISTAQLLKGVWSDALDIIQICKTEAGVSQCINIGNMSAFGSFTKDEVIKTRFVRICKKFRLKFIPPCTTSI